MDPCSRLRTFGYLALGSLPLCYLHVPGLPPFIRSLALLAAGAAFAAARLLAPQVPSSGPRPGPWFLCLLAWQLLSATTSLPAFRWPALWPVLHGAAALAVAAGVAGDPARRRGLALSLAGGGLALLLFTFNILSGGQAEVWTLGGRLQGSPIDHLPFGNRNTSALLISSLIPPALAATWTGWKNRRPFRSGAGFLAFVLLAWLLARTNALGALVGLVLGGALTLGLVPRIRALPLILLLGLGAALVLGAALARPHFPAWRLTTSFGLRTLVWESAARGWSGAPLAGLGTGSFALRFPEFRTERYPFSQYAAPRALHAYNLPLHTLCENGLVGLLLLAATLLSLLGAWQRSQAGPWRLAAVWTCLALLVQAMGGDALIEPLGLACFAAATGAGLSSRPPQGTGVPGEPRPAVALRKILAVCVIGAALFPIAAEACQVMGFSLGHRLKEEGSARYRAGDESGAREAWTLAETAYRRASEAALPSLLALDARFEQAVCLMQLGLPTEALAAYRTLLERGGSYGNAGREAARAALLAGDAPQAIRLLRAHLRFNPCDVEGYRLLLPLVPQEACRLDQAFWEAAALAPDSHPMLAQGMSWRCEIADWQGAWELSRRILGEGPVSDGIGELALGAGLRSGHASQALELAGRLPPEARGRLRAGLDERLKAEPANTTALGIRFLIRLSQGDPAGAREDLDAIPHGPGPDALRVALASLLPEGF